MATFQTCHIAESCYNVTFVAVPTPGYAAHLSSSRSVCAYASVRGCDMSAHPKAICLLTFVLTLQDGNKSFTCSPHATCALKVWPRSTTVAAGAGLHDAESSAMNHLEPTRGMMRGSVEVAEASCIFQHGVGRREMADDSSGTVQHDNACGDNNSLLMHSCHRSGSGVLGDECTVSLEHLLL